MMNFRCIIVACLFLVGEWMTARAEIYDVLHLKNGSVVEGHIVSQRPGKSIEFMTERAIVVVNGSRVKTVVSQKMKVESLSDEWKQWVKDNPRSTVNEGGVAYLNMSKLQISDDVDFDSVAVDTAASNISISQDKEDPLLVFATDRMVRILENGNVLRYCDLTPTKYTFPISQVVSIERKTRDLKTISGLVDVIETRDGRKCEGQIVMQRLGNSISILTNDGVLQTFANKDIARQQKKKLNPDQDIIEQTPFLDVVQTANREYRGVIVLQDYGTKDKESFLRIQEQTGNLSDVSVKSVYALQRLENWNYRPLSDIELNDSDVYINRVEAKTFKCKKNKNGQLVISQKDMDGRLVLMPSAKEKTLVVETRNNARSQMFILVGISKEDVDKKGNYLLGYERLARNAIQPQKSNVSPMQTLYREYPFGKGYFVVYHPDSDEVNIIEVR